METFKTGDKCLKSGYYERIEADDIKTGDINWAEEGDEFSAHYEERAYYKFIGDKPQINSEK